MHLIYSFLPIVSIVTFLLSFLVSDFDQCNRRCRLEFSPKQESLLKRDYGFKMTPYSADQIDNKSISGKRIVNAKMLWNKFKHIYQQTINEALDDECNCYSETDNHPKYIGTIKRHYEPYEPGYPYLWKNKEVCGLNGKTYKSSYLAKQDNTKVVSCGPCGSCSNSRDIYNYRKYSKPMTKMLSKCAISYLFLGKEAGRICLNSLFDFSPECANRFIDNFGCTISHCINECLFTPKNNPLLDASANIENQVDHHGKLSKHSLTSCYLCDEIYCSPIFISTAGANRRGSGTQTDISRPKEEICQEGLTTEEIVILNHDR